MTQNGTFRVYFRKSPDYATLYNDVTSISSALIMKKELNGAGYDCCLKVLRNKRWISLQGWNYGY